MVDPAVLAALRNSIDIALYVEAAGVERCANAVVIRALSLSAMGPAHAIALAAAWDTGLPIDTPASVVLTVAYDRLVCEGIEANF